MPNSVAAIAANPIIVESAASKQQKKRRSKHVSFMGGPADMKVSTVDVESGDNMATLPVSQRVPGGVRPDGGGAGGSGSSASDVAEKNNAANKEMELKNVMPQPLQR